MSFKSQEDNMRRLAELLSHDLGNIWGERECGPNGDKKVFLNVGKTFLRALGKDLGLRDFKVTSNAAGIAVSGECTLIGIWEDSGIYICIEQPSNMAGNVLLYRTVRNMKDYKGGYNRFLNRRELARMSYSQLLNTLLALRKEVAYDWAA